MVGVCWAESRPAHSPPQYRREERSHGRMRDVPKGPLASGREAPVCDRVGGGAPSAFRRVSWVNASRSHTVTSAPGSPSRHTRPL